VRSVTFLINRVVDDVRFKMLTPACADAAEIFKVLSDPTESASTRLRTRVCVCDLSAVLAYERNPRFLTSCAY